MARADVVSVFDKRENNLYMLLPTGPEHSHHPSHPLGNSRVAKKAVIYPFAARSS
jgi:hypothetical protein